jgi:hypothetical protein
MSTDLLEEALRLSPRDRLQLIGDLWDTLSEEDIPVTSKELAHAGPEILPGHRGHE